MKDTGWVSRPTMFRHLEEWVRTVTWPTDPGDDGARKRDEILRDWQCGQGGAIASWQTSADGAVTLTVRAQIDSGD